MSLLYDIKTYECTRDTVVYAEGDPVQYFYMIIEGEIELSVVIERSTESAA
jgi:CRP-like cAMP-binding protein